YCISAVGLCCNRLYSYVLTNPLTTSSATPFPTRRSSDLHRNRLDKQPEHLTQDEKEGLHHMISELQDVLFEGTGFVNRLMQDYQIKPQQLNQNRDAKLRMERRI